jgi:hypothetical protein
MPSFDQVLEQAIELPYEQRERLVKEISKSLHPPADELSEEKRNAAWATELDRRIQADRRGEYGATRYPEVMEKLRQELKERTEGGT